MGALSILDFLQIPDDQLQTVDGRALNPIYKEYGLGNDKTELSLKDFGLPTRALVNRQMVKFHLAYMYLTHQFKSDIGRGYTEDKPEISRSFLSTSFYSMLTADFFVAYLQWLKELRGNQRSFMPFMLDTDKLADALNGITPKTGFLKSAIDYKAMLAMLNRLSQQALKNRAYNDGNVARKLLELMDEALEKLIDDKYNGVV